MPRRFNVGVGAARQDLSMPISSLLVVTGAGASRSLGSNATPLPLMPGWCADLVGRLGQKQIDLPERVGLRKEMSGEQFEQRLGHFLAWQRSLPTAKSLLTLGARGVQDQFAEQINEWFNLAESNASLVQDVIHESLYDLFGAPRISDVWAGRAYGWLLRQCQVEATTPTIFATTNYDISIEMALSHLGKRPFWGEDASPTNATSLRVHAEGMVERARWGQVPVIHLHGRVGWYVSDSGEVVSISSPTYNKQWGQPALLLPDPDKDYATLRLVDDLWREFDRAIDAASHILVLGHSLNDAALVARLRDAATDQRRVAVSVFQEGPMPGGAANSEVARITDLQPRATVVPINFRPDEPWMDQTAFSNWLGG